MDVKPALSIDSKSEMRFPKRDSYFFIGTAGQKAFGRGDTVSRAHLSEAAFYDDLEKILGGIAEAAEYGQIDIETTPNGREQFYDMWQKAKTGKSPYTPIFIPWFIDDEYSVDSLTAKEREGLSVGVRAMFEIPSDVLIASYTKEEKLLIANVLEKYKIELTPGQMKWRRYKIWDKGDLFWQEYPEDDVSCFLQSGRSVFKKITTDITKKIPLDDLKNWKTKEKRNALRGRMLYGGLDGAEGSGGGDNHCFVLIDADLETGISYVIYEYASNEPIDVFWSHIESVIMNKKTQEPKLQISLGIEKNGIGAAHVKKAIELRVQHTPWVTSGGPGGTRPVMISELEEAYRKEILIESYTEAEDEARNMIYTGPLNRPEHLSGKHDDRVFARAIALQMRNKPTPKISWL